MDISGEESDPTPYCVSLPNEMKRVMAVGTVGMFLGVLGLCTLPLVAEPVTSDYLGRGGTIADRGLINTWGMISTNAGCALAAAVFIGAIGALRIRSWARPILLLYGIASVLLGLAGIYFHALIIQTAQSGEGTPEFATRVSALAEWLAWAIGMLFGAWTLWVMTRPGVKGAFERGNALE